MQEVLDQLKTLVHGVWLHRWVVILVAWLICLIGWPFVVKYPDQFESQAKVYVDTQSLLSPLLRGLTIQTNPAQQVQLIVKTLFTRPNLEKIARLADLDIKADTSQDFDLMIVQLKSELKLSTAGRDNIYSISYSSKSANDAKNVVQATLTTLVENTLGDNRTDSDIATKFIDRQIEEYATRLNEADNRLKEFKKANYELMSNDTGYYSRIQSLKATIASVNLELNEAKTRLKSASQQLAGEQPTFGIMQDSFTPQFGVSSSFDNRIESLENNLDELRLKYTDIHPDIKETQRIIDDLKRKRDIELEERHKETELINSQRGNNGLNENPVYQELKLALAREESNVSSLRVRSNTYKAQLKELQSKIDSIPEIEAELKALDRGYQVTQAKHTELLNRRESAHLSQQADASSNSFQFRIIDPPRMPTKPSGPNRPLFLSGVLGAALAAGLGFAFLISQIKPVFFSARQLNAVTGFPVLGSVSVYSTGEVIRHQRKKRWSFSLLVIGLLGLYLGMLLQQLFPDINNQVALLLPDMPTEFKSVYFKAKLMLANLINQF
ncbi:MAG: XrtA system polysaccharide chain length determinant [Halopseudomonas sp.]